MLCLTCCPCTCTGMRAPWLPRQDPTVEHIRARAAWRSRARVGRRSGVWLPSCGSFRGHAAPAHAGQAGSTPAGHPCAWLLLLFCASPRCSHVLRALPPEASLAFAESHDAAIAACVTDLLGTGPLPGSALKIAQLPFQQGRLNLRSGDDTHEVSVELSRALVQGGSPECRQCSGMRRFSAPLCLGHVVNLPTRWQFCS